MRDGGSIRARSGANQEGANAHNRRIMMEALRLNGALSRADLARATRLTKQTVSNIIDELGRDGLVQSLDAVRKGRGQPSTPYRLVPEGAFAIGVQIDRHTARVVAVDLVGSILARAEANLPSGGPASGVAVILDLVAQVRSELACLRSQAEERLVGLGVAMPGPFGLADAPDDPWMMAAWQRFPLVDRLAAGTGLDVGLQNDSAACATAERMVGALHGLDHAVCLYVGYGIGAGLILNGELYAGGHGNAGEVGMALLVTAGPEPMQLEHRAALAPLYHRLGLDPADPCLGARVEALVVVDDPRVGAWVAAAAHDLRKGVQLIETVLDPQTIVMTSSAPQILARKLVEAMHPLLPSIADRPQRALPRLQLGTTDIWAITLGAAAGAISHAFDPRFSAILKSHEGKPR